MASANGSAATAAMRNVSESLLEGSGQRKELSALSAPDTPRFARAADPHAAARPTPATVRGTSPGQPPAPARSKTYSYSRTQVTPDARAVPDPQGRPPSPQRRPGPMGAGPPRAAQPERAAEEGRRRAQRPGTDRKRLRTQWFFLHRPGRPARSLPVVGALYATTAGHRRREDGDPGTGRARRRVLHAAGPGARRRAVQRPVAADCRH